MPFLAKPTLRSFLCAIAIFVFATLAFAQDSHWIRPEKPGDPLIWGWRGGIVFGLPSAGGLKGPRGLIRAGVGLPPEYTPQLLNYIAIEPVIEGPGSRFSRMAFSELEPSVLDPGERGKRLWVADNTFRGDLRTIRAGHAVVERLSVKIDVERFTANGAHVYLIASIDSDHPDELRISVFNESDGPPLDELTVTATMGNYERLRLLWLKDRVEDSRRLFPDYTGDAFVEHENYPLDEMLRTADGDAIVYCTSNEPSPESASVNAAAHWKYTLPKLTQYWRVPAHDIQPDLRVRVNARWVYWASTDPVPGGIAFENFEVRQRYVPGQTFIYGIFEHEPWEIDPRLGRFKESINTHSAGPAK
ncbi:hypothetical protein [Alloacidobacterium sp.]|uniref:hypothetical protein n=1 Tax=Alloacidobacterium sp. TaxID=2951999 RepID=UPI002D612321|nr:hypothetical protein [Alloacidobacterium sp.]HYK35061.1 hypothetical protein [Alloacidobacterium sp.]